MSRPPSSYAASSNVSPFLQHILDSEAADSVLTASIAPLELPIPTEFQRTNDHLSHAAQAPAATPIRGYEGLDLTRPSLHSFTIAVSSLNKDSWVWQYGYRLDKTDNKGKTVE
ncbi:unnamed protein product [Zymoseptoria tritici ST99CH_1A5]|uniref:Uncharacterized protein n=1 Tax=Zymoseptoria tritici ST99CH_1A5 TaxID=1276529 RepID=A0A1Y6M417_ZYMTR|nr:unnamed protein product [Zymoseptoria tritici ST99CH_1A5]